MTVTYDTASRVCAVCLETKPIVAYRSGDTLACAKCRAKRGAKAKAAVKPHHAYVNSPTDGRYDVGRDQPPAPLAEVPDVCGKDASHALILPPRYVPFYGYWEAWCPCDGWLVEVTVAAVAAWYERRSA